MGADMCLFKTPLMYSLKISYHHFYRLLSRVCWRFTCFAGESPLMTTTGISESESMLHHISPRADAELLKLKEIEIMKFHDSAGGIAATWKLSGPRVHPWRFSSQADISLRWRSSVRSCSKYDSRSFGSSKPGGPGVRLATSSNEPAPKPKQGSPAYPCLPYVSLCTRMLPFKCIRDIYQKVCQFRWEAQCAWSAQCAQGFAGCLWDAFLLFSAARQCSHLGAGCHVQRVGMKWGMFRMCSGCNEDMTLRSALLGP